MRPRHGAAAVGLRWWLLAAAQVIGARGIAVAQAPHLESPGALPTYNNGGVEWTGGTCSSRERQSPVNFERLLKYPPQDYLDYHYEPIEGPLTLKATGGFFVADVGQALRGGVVFSNEFFPLTAIHIHGPAEHLIAGKRNPLELQLMHRSFKDPKKVLVVSMLIWSKETPAPPPKGPAPAYVEPSKNEYGFNPHLHNFLTAPPPSVDGATSSLTVKLDLGKLVEDAKVADSGSYLSYAGSMTSPPCIDHASWFVRRRIVLASSSQVRALSDALYRLNSFKKGEREVMPWNRRIVRVYKARYQEVLNVGKEAALPWGPNPRTDGEMKAHKLAQMARKKAESAAWYAEDFARRVHNADVAFARALRGPPPVAAPPAGQSQVDREVAYNRAVRAVREAVLGASRHVRSVVDAAYRSQATGLYGAVAQLHQHADDLVNLPPPNGTNASLPMPPPAR